ncbi:MAG: ribose 5-phosphate isomerase B [Holosporaceae bacterium]|nr:ribose 5-phosphate isomerase B [Holosporaceae bacterium]
MKIFIASDHVGFGMKRYLIEKSEWDLTDLGTDCPESCDYPIFARKLSDCVLEAGDNCGILICSTGIGMSIAANRCVGIRAALCFNEKMAEFSRRHNDANVIVFGANVVNYETAANCLRVFLQTEFEGGRHNRRLKLIDGE